MSIPPAQRPVGKMNSRLYNQYYAFGSPGSAVCQTAGKH